MQKRLHRSLFVVPAGEVVGAGALKIDAKALAQLLAGVACEENRKRYLT